MPVAKKIFELSETPEIKQSPTVGFLRFRGIEAFALASFCVNKGGDQPHLIIVCRGKRGKGATHIYDGFRITELEGDGKSAQEISVKCHNPLSRWPTPSMIPLRLLFRQNAVTACKDAISYIDTLERRFPMQEYEAYRGRLRQARVELRRQVEASPYAQALKV
ncbi:MAG: hypothetical protein WBK91_02755 [Alphaproteobacteria bacterium]